MADVTISDLELAPALADDMVFPVENTTDTYAATLAMLRRLINKTFVEVEDADFNDLTDDGFYQCTGTPTNSPEAGEINWTLQVSAESGVVVQRAFSLDDNFANLYIRRWNGVTWTAWIEEGGGALTHKANVDLDNLSTTGLNVLNKIVPTGSIIIFSGATAPEGYLLCNGGAISRTTYADLFSVIGTIYGAGNGTTTFNIPNIKPNYGSTAAVVGNGKAMGLINGQTGGYLCSWRPGSAVSGTLSLSTSNILGNNSTIGYASGTTSAFGLTTDAGTSGIKANLNVHTNINYYIKY